MGGKPKEKIRGGGGVSHPQAREESDNKDSSLFEKDGEDQNKSKSSFHELAQSWKDFHHTMFSESTSTNVLERENEKKKKEEENNDIEIQKGKEIDNQHDSDSSYIDEDDFIAGAYAAKVQKRKEETARKMAENENKLKQLEEQQIQKQEQGNDKNQKDEQQSEYTNFHEKSII